MAKPLVHAESSARRYGGIPEDYIELHDFMDSSKASFPDNRHRALTHNAWFIGTVLERVFGHEIELTCTQCNGAGEIPVLDGGMLPRPSGIPLPMQSCNKCDCTGKHGRAHVRDIGEQHVLEDFGGKFIPTVSDYLEGMEFHEWMNNAISGTPTSHRKLAAKTGTMRRRAVSLD